MKAFFGLIQRFGLIMGLLALIGLGGCRRQPLSEHAVHESLAEKRERHQTDIEQGVQAAPPPAEVPNTQPSGDPSGQASQGSGVPPYEAPPPTITSTPAPKAAPATPSDTRKGEVQLDPSTGQYGIAPPGAPEGYTIPLENPRSNPPSESK
ncbi:MAG: hypothetical protein NZL85_01990 [Fimbriimonadales bacterium]|nr:hypothetical protein [Fimbriimonadales bacterium]